MSVNHVKSAVLCLLANTALSASEISEKKATVLQFEKTIEQAIADDPWIEGSWHDQSRLKSLSIAAGELPDPTVTLGLANLAADTFDFDQERMTHLKLGVTQQFPRGNSRALRKHKLQTQSEKYPFLRQNRAGQITLEVGQIWLDLYQVQESMRLIRKNRELFEKLVEVANNNYSSAFFNTTQFDIVQAELELSLLDDRLAALMQQQENRFAQLSEWLGYGVDLDVKLPSGLPEITMIDKTAIEYQHLTGHPAVMAIEQTIDSESVGIELSKQKYKPAWSINLGYGYREDAPSGLDRSDLLSLSVNFDVPLFTANRQDQEVNAAVQTQARLLTEKEQIMRKLMHMHQQSVADLKHLRKRGDFYRSTLLPQTKQSIEIALNAYSTDEGEFSEVVRAQISELNTALELLKIEVDIQKTILNLNYTLMTDTHEILHATVSGESS